ncbi:hypothetical protein BDR07DRAFT_1486419 [Suillus spraguei]|nr:hypothetical protein BDR07DRAFT_1499804 [Suillus spraguei]KAG2360958.1 hypothetical protein BDR07DRAFT_1486419 [Suillus spraguei]
MDIDAMLPLPGEEGFGVSHWSEEHALYSELEQITHAQINNQYDALTDALLTYQHDGIEVPEVDNSDDMFENQSSGHIQSIHPQIQA